MIYLAEVRSGVDLVILFPTRKFFRDHLMCTLYTFLLIYMIEKGAFVSLKVVVVIHECMTIVLCDFKMSS
ncbi:hypothetical protein AtNW77_Chr5g0120271 [Arabidopsis thaliana]